MNLEDVNISRELKIVFMGTPLFAKPVLEGLLEHYKVRAIVTQPDKLVGRKQEVSFSPVKQVGIDNYLLVLQPTNIKESYQEIIDLQPDLIITCAYGQILPKELLEVPRLGCINVHASLLPKLRGGAPIHRAIMNGHSKTGITIMYMSQSMDTGDIIYQEETPIYEEDNLDSLYNRLSLMGRDTLLKVLPSIIEGTNNRVKQNHDEATYGLNIKREDEKIDFNKTKKEVHNHIRGLNSFPGAYTTYKGLIMKVYESYVTDNIFNTKHIGEITNIYPDGFGVRVTNGEVVITTIKLEGKKKMSAIEFLNGINKEEFIKTILR